MRILTLNLRHGGGVRMPGLQGWLLRQRAQVLVLTEFRNNAAGLELLAALCRGGLTHQRVSTGRPGINALAVAATQPFEAVPGALARLDPLRLLPLRFAAFELVALHLPNLEAKLPHWSALLRLAHREPAPARLLMGDFNTGSDMLDAARGPFAFHGAEHWAGLEALGWVEAWRHLHPRGRQYSWYSQRGRGFRIDHAWISTALQPSLRGARYLHQPRLQRLTDHSALLVELAEVGTPPALQD